MPFFLNPLWLRLCRVGNRTEITSRFSGNMISSRWVGAQQGAVQDGDVRHGRLCTENRTDDETPVRLAGRGRSSAICRHRVHEAWSWWGRVHFPCASVRPQDHPPGTGRIGRDGRPGHESCPKKRGGRKKLVEISAALEANFFKLREDHTAGEPIGG